MLHTHTCHTISKLWCKIIISKSSCKCTSITTVLNGCVFSSAPPPPHHHQAIVQQHIYIVMKLDDTVSCLIYCTRLAGYIASFLQFSKNGCCCHFNNKKKFFADNDKISQFPQVVIYLF